MLGGEMKALITCLFFGLVIRVYAVPPPPEKKENVVNGAEVIAVVTISKVETSPEKDGVITEVATLEVEQVLKGSLPQGAKLQGFIDRFPCHTPTLQQSKGRALVFLRRDGEFYRKSGTGWEQLRPVQEGRVMWFESEPVPLAKAAEDIMRIVGSK